MEEFKVNSTYKQPTGTNGLDRWRGAQPRHGWRNPELSSFFSWDPVTSTVTPSTVTSPTVTPPTVTPPTDTPSQSKTEPPLIIGASVGGFIGLILTGAFIYWCFWVYVPMRQKREETQGHTGGVSSGSVPASIVGQSRQSEHELDAGGGSIRSPTIPGLDHSLQHSPNSEIEFQDPDRKNTI